MNIFFLITIIILNLIGILFLISAKKRRRELTNKVLFSAEVKLTTLRVDIMGGIYDTLGRSFLIIFFLGILALFYNKNIIIGAAGLFIFIFSVMFVKYY